MNKQFNTTKKAAILAMNLLLAACTTDLYTPEKGPEVDPNGKAENGIPNDVTWKTTITKSVTVNVIDEYDGQRYYKVEFYTTDPLTDKNATQLDGQMTNSRIPYVAKLVIPASAQRLYILQTDPYGTRSLFPYDLVEGDMVCTLGSVITGTKGLTLRDKEYDETIPAEVPENAKSLTTLGWLSGGDYVINSPITSTYLDGNAQVNLYIASTLTYTGSINGDMNIHILPGGKLICNGSVNLKNKFTIASGGILEADRVNLQNANAILINEGVCQIKEKIQFESAAKLKNLCYLKTKEFNAQSATATIELVSGAIDCEVADLQGVKEMKMDAKSIFRCAGNVNLHKIDIVGETGLSMSSYALFKAKSFTFNSKGIVLKNAVCLWGTYNDAERVTTEGGILTIDDPKAIDIENSSCNGDNGHPKPGDPEGGNSGDLSTSGTYYVYMFEDNWPSHGDYDMNDMVVSVSLSKIKKGDKLTGVTLKGAVLAVGATKQLALGGQLDDVMKNNIASVTGATFESENPGSYASFLLTDNAHDFMGSVPGKGAFVNTYEAGNSMPFEVVINFKESIGDINEEALNMFITYGNISGKDRPEVHLADKAGTGWAASSKDSYNYKYKGDEKEYENMPWGLMVEAEKFGGYPKETVNIKNAYDGFSEWATSESNVLAGNWYQTPNNGNTIKIASENK